MSEEIAATPAKRELSNPGSPETKPTAKKQDTENKDVTGLELSTASDKQSTTANEEKPKFKREKQPPKPKKRKYKAKDVDETSPAGVLQFEIAEILEENQLTENDIANDISSILNSSEAYHNYHREVEHAEIIKLTSNGDGLALIANPVETQKKQIVIVPFAIKGDIVTIRVFKTHPNYVESDLLKIETGGPDRDNSLIRCEYFGKCSGCQYQQLTYDTQLLYKKQTIENAYKFLAPKLQIPEVLETIPSPKQFSYRTKLTPHFDISKRVPQVEQPMFGFGAKGKSNWRETRGGDKSIVDIEECIIGTQMVNIGMANERKRFETTWKNYKKSATILLRENTKVIKDLQTPVEQQLDPASTDSNDKISYIEETSGEDKLAKTCVTETRQIVTEYINGFTFEFCAGEFFQNNNSILPKVTEYVCSNLQIPRPEGTPLYLVDAYCGSGLFSITASKGVDKVVGVDVSKESIRFAKMNAERNNVKNAVFIDGKAEKIFNEIDTPNDLTSIIIDPSRKGCDLVFLNQLSAYKPAKIVYVSCNVHSQARDLQQFLLETENGHEYKIESLRGFDFFPQTHHVESVVVLSRV
ncbi:hypothetical protein WICPIJ_000661 [Wickerhamomyces pijperi]|uniref:TRAM domain-containing protein n=1 Tax=Wickerhamomyces pijperi TaxID=599730 RepID=A0A9P8TRM0_WICPI|nr:hypothetical protein WICPIJ_000661 [Wickerhamomyces pijperi]